VTDQDDSNNNDKHAGKIAGGALTGHLVLNVHGMGVVIFAMGAWFIIVAVEMMRGKV